MSVKVPPVLLDPFIYPNYPGLIQWHWDNSMPQLIAWFIGQSIYLTTGPNNTLRIRHKSNYLFTTRKASKPWIFHKTFGNGSFVSFVSVLGLSVLFTWCSGPLALTGYLVSLNLQNVHFVVIDIFIYPTPSALLHHSKSPSVDIHFQISRNDSLRSQFDYSGNWK